MKLRGDDRAGLLWVRTWAKNRLTAAKGLCKHRPPGQEAPEGEEADLQALADLKGVMDHILRRESREKR